MMIPSSPACRSEEKCKQTRELLSGQVHESSYLDCLALDLSDLSSIVKFCKGLKEAGKTINVLINNAGVYLTEFSESIDGLETLYFFFPQLVFGWLTK